MLLDRKMEAALRSWERRYKLQLKTTCPRLLKLLSAEQFEFNELRPALEQIETALRPIGEEVWHKLLIIVGPVLLTEGQSLLSLSLAEFPAKTSWLPTAQSLAIRGLSNFIPHVKNGSCIPLSRRGLGSQLHEFHPQGGAKIHPMFIALGALCNAICRSEPKEEERDPESPQDSASFDE